MRIHGIDFTSTPARAKPLVCADACLEGGVLAVESLTVFEGPGDRAFEALAAHLLSGGTAVAGFDFPFSLSRKVLVGPHPLFPDMSWPAPWEPFARRLADLSREDFAALLEAYKAPRPKGDKQHKRLADEAARAQSPQTLHYTPVARMFHAGAALFLKHGFDVAPQRRTDCPLTAVEAYPGLFVREMAGKAPYKAEAADRANNRPEPARARHEARARILDALEGPACRARYGLRTVLAPRVRERALEDATGDTLDSALCALQAAWAWERRSQGWGMPGPERVDPAMLAFEGWIADPACIAPARP
ncbi:hypothetical protein NNJEOMEG_01481 [Fundidesulfovibrio magnetotacticus]|uniref:DUF429 domain-containing protein n=1 Tax=Fundidesulfovibrio magnetotacticus TaxID=2730080 RepID=A0A6V8LVF0_9BACT|nr:DUF429 domain-containing protein [Fundidesulfovibrio magnetotacticus]GFK93647.1 hypothetical protein NNJEOMEG_01481 [Fundidesulfovibrio magnetotacticus]